MYMWEIIIDAGLIKNSTWNFSLHFFTFKLLYYLFYIYYDILFYQTTRVYLVYIVRILLFYLGSRLIKSTWSKIIIFRFVKDKNFQDNKATVGCFSAGSKQRGIVPLWKENIGNIRSVINSAPPGMKTIDSSSGITVVFFAIC